MIKEYVIYNGPVTKFKDDTISRQGYLYNKIYGIEHIKQ